MKPGAPPRARLLDRGEVPSKVIVIVTRRIGDVLLSTAVLKSIKRAWPATTVDVLVLSGTESVLIGNPDVNRVLTIPQRPRLGTHLRFLARLWRRYDVALSLVPGDRPTLYAFVAGRRRAGLLLSASRESWKRTLLHSWVPFDECDTHRVAMNLALLDVIDVPPVREVSVSWGKKDEEAVATLLNGIAPPYAVLHPYPKFSYKMWRQQGWIEVARWLHAQGYRIVLTGSPDPAELDYVTAVAKSAPNAINAAGKLTLGGTGRLLSRAALYVGPDTAVTHMAAALGVPTVALFGPTDPVKWGPWPSGHGEADGPWRRHGSQTAGNVWLLQGRAACVPCGLEGCERHIGSFSDCLLGIDSDQVITAVRAVTGIPS
jgi:heptosyltransferase-3